MPLCFESFMIMGEKLRRMARELSVMRMAFAKRVRV